MEREALMMKVVASKYLVSAGTSFGRDLECERICQLLVMNLKKWVGCSKNG